MKTVIYHCLSIVLFFLYSNCVLAKETNFSGTLSDPFAIADVDMLAINETVKQLLDENVKHIRHKELRTKFLHKYLFTEEGLNIQYSEDVTLTAQETFDQGKGNCLSLASLYIASARYVGLNAKFQNVAVPRSWKEGNGFYVIPGHVNVSVHIEPGARAIVEFVSTYIPKEIPGDKISDNYALAQYYSNLGAEHLSRREIGPAIAYLVKSVNTSKKVAHAWSNLGVAYRLNKQYLLAEQAYLNALAIDKRDMSTVNNLYKLYKQTEQHHKAEKYAERVARYARKNPYYLARLAVSDMEVGDLNSALKKMKKAIKLNPDEHKFYATLAAVYFKQERFKDAEKTMKKARDIALGESEKNTYQEKLNAILSMSK